MFAVVVYFVDVVVAYRFSIGVVVVIVVVAAALSVS